METRNTDETPLPPIDADRPDSAATGTATTPFPAASPLWSAPTTTPSSWAETNSDEEYTPRRRPAGVTVIAIVNFIGAALILLIFLGALSTGQDMGLAAIVLPIDVIVGIAVGIGMLQLRGWARTLAFIGYGINIVIDIIGILTGPVEGPTLINLAIAGIIIWYLRQPQVAEVFD